MPGGSILACGKRDPHRIGVEDAREREHDHCEHQTEGERRAHGNTYELLRRRAVLLAENHARNHSRRHANADEHARDEPLHDIQDAESADGHSGSRRREHDLIQGEAACHRGDVTRSRRTTGHQDVLQVVELQALY